jgi:hypothetical protein
MNMDGKKGPVEVRNALDSRWGGPGRKLGVAIAMLYLGSTGSRYFSQRTVDWRFCPSVWGGGSVAGVEDVSRFSG